MGGSAVLVAHLDGVVASCHDLRKLQLHVYHGWRHVVPPTNKKCTQDKKSDEIITKDSLSPTVHQVWEFGTMAYSAYAVLLPLALSWCIVLPQVRPSFCWAMTT